MSALIEGTKRSSRIIILILLSLTAGSLLSMVPVRYLPFLLGAAVLAGVAVFCFIRPALLIYVVILTSTASGLLRVSQPINLGGTSLTVSGLRWVFVAGMALFILGAYISKIHIPAYLTPFILFVLWAIARSMVGPVWSSGIKDILFYGLPPLMGIYTFFLVSTSDRLAVGRIEKALLYSVFIPPFLYLVFISTGLIMLTLDGPKGVLEPRAVALYLLIALASSLALWRYGSNGNLRRMGFLVSLLALGTVFFTLSRMASLSALIILALSRANPCKLWRLLSRMTLAILVALLMLMTIPSFRERSFHEPGAALTTKVQSLNLYGRDQFWPITLDSALKKPLLGWGPGSARVLVAGAFPWKGTSEYHPHNEYLQAFHDLGVIGLALLVMAWIPLLVRSRKNWANAHRSGDLLRSKWNMAATLAVLVILITSITDNTMHYAFVTVPALIITGVAYYLELVTQSKGSADKAQARSFKHAQA